MPIYLNASYFNLNISHSKFLDRNDAVYLLPNFMQKKCLFEDAN